MPLRGMPHARSCSPVQEGGCPQVKFERNSVELKRLAAQSDHGRLWSWACVDCRRALGVFATTAIVSALEGATWKSALDSARRPSRREMLPSCQLHLNKLCREKSP